MHNQMNVFLHLISQREIVTGIMLVLAWIVGIIIVRILFFVTNRARRGRQGEIGDVLLRRSRKPLGFIVPLLCLLSVAPYLPLEIESISRAERLIGMATIAAFAWALVAAITIMTDIITVQARRSGDDLHQREVETRIYILSRVMVASVVLVAAAAALMTIPTVRSIGATLLASAGIAGVAGGLAARPVLENLIAGIQIAFTQPIRLGDVVIVEGEYGTIEEITATYIVVKCWDWRRLIVPLSEFIDKPFQVWSRRDTQLIGTVFLYADYKVNVEDIRKELAEFLTTQPLFDGKVQNVQVVDVTEKSIQIRILVTSDTAPHLWDLRCAVREHFVTHLTMLAEDSLPRDRQQYVGGTDEQFITRAQAALSGAKPQDGIGPGPVDSHEGPMQMGANPAHGS